LWFLSDDRSVDIHGCPAVLGEGCDDALQEDLGIRVLERGIGVGELVADIGQARCAEQGVTNGMSQRVGIGMAVETEIGVKGNSSEDQFTTGNGAVDVVAVTDAKIHRMNVTTKLVKINPARTNPDINGTRMTGAPGVFTG